MRFLRSASKGGSNCGSRGPEGPVPRPCVESLTLRQDATQETTRHEMRRGVVCSVAKIAEPRRRSQTEILVRLRACEDCALACAERIRLCRTARRAVVALVHLHQQHEQLMRHFLGHLVAFPEPFADHGLHDPIKGGGLSGLIYCGTTV